MRAYYEQRAREYDDWWLGTGLFAGRDRPGWDEEVAELAEVLSSLPPCRCLDVACGTGFLTRHLRGDVTAVDQSASMAAIARGRLPAAEVVHGDALPLPFADGAFDRVVTGHFYGHLLDAEREAFVADARRVARELVVVDSALRDDEPAEGWQERVLRDGSRHRVYVAKGHRNPRASTTCSATSSPTLSSRSRSISSPRSRRSTTWTLRRRWVACARCPHPLAAPLALLAHLDHTGPLRQVRSIIGRRATGR